MRPNAYRRNLLEHFRRHLGEIGPLVTALDFGSGDGWFAHAAMESGLVENVVCVDVQARRRSYVEPVLYDGRVLPFADHSFDLVYALDVLHHTPAPAETLRDALRCSGRYFVLKDHTYRRPAGKLVLAMLDEIGNRRFGVPSLYHYQRGWEWLPVIEKQRFALEELQYPITIETRPILSSFVNHFQFIGRWQRAG
jgi:SAM-dependent methyltransferase